MKKILVGLFILFAFSLLNAKSNHITVKNNSGDKIFVVAYKGAKFPDWIDTGLIEDGKSLNFDNDQDGYVAISAKYGKNQLACINFANEHGKLTFEVNMEKYHNGSQKLKIEKK